MPHPHCPWVWALPSMPNRCKALRPAVSGWLPSIFSSRTDPCGQGAPGAQQGTGASLDEWMTWRPVGLPDKAPMGHGGAEEPPFPLLRHGGWEPAQSAHPREHSQREPGPWTLSNGANSLREGPQGRLSSGGARTMLPPCLGCQATLEALALWKAGWACGEGSPGPLSVPG